VFLCDILLAVIIHPRQGYIVTHPKILIHWKLGSLNLNYSVLPCRLV